MAEQTTETAMSVDSGVGESNSSVSGRSDATSFSDAMSTHSSSTIVGPQSDREGHAPGPMTQDLMPGFHNPQQSASSDSGYRGSSTLNLDGFQQIPFDSTARTGQWVQESNFEIFVQDFQGKSHTIKVEAEEKVENLEKKVSETLRLDQSQQYLTYQGKPLEKGKTLSQCQIKRHSTVQCMGRLRGGCDLHQLNILPGLQ